MHVHPRMNMHAYIHTSLSLCTVIKRKNKLNTQLRQTSNYQQTYIYFTGTDINNLKNLT